MVMKTDAVFKRGLGIISLFSTVGMYVAGFGILIMAVLITTEIVGRHLFGFSILVVDEWSGYLLVMVTFLGLAYTMKTNGFLQIEFLLNRLSPKQRRIFHTFLISVAFFYSILIDHKLITYTWSSYATGLVSVSISQTPLFIPQLFMPLGMTLLALELLRQGVLSLRGLPSFDPNKTQNRNNKT
jgi:TRAP-type C4-dicarboxylate transport system permease small subunit